MKKISFFLIFFMFVINASSQQHIVWQLGQQDKSPAEFALTPYDYRKYSEIFGTKPVVFEIGKNKEKTDFPFVLPGASDSWAGSRGRQLFIRFGINNQQIAGTTHLEINYVNVHGDAPTLEVMVNGFKTKVRTPHGGNSDYFTHKKYNQKELKTTIEVPDNVLRKGNNYISIKSVGGSWVVFDNIVLKSSQKLTLGKTVAGIDLLGAEATPALVYGKNKERRQPVTLQVANWGNPQTVSLSIDGNKYEQIKLKPGINTIETNVPETSVEKDVAIGISSGSKLLGECRVKTYPVKDRTIYLVQHSHTDIGYTRPQTEILAEHIRYIDYAIEYCELTENYPEDAKFKWLCEATWPVKEYLNNRPQAQVDKFLKYIKNGQIEVAGMFFNMAEIIDENSFKTFLEPIRQLKDLGVPVKTAMQNDVNGIAWCLADYMPDLGINYFSMGQNSRRALVPFDRLTVFKWVSPSGKTNYSYRSDHYRAANRWGIDSKDIDGMAPAVFSYLDNLDKYGYPFDAILVQMSGYHVNNSPPSIIPNNRIREWNEKYASPKMKSALFHEFMDYIVSKYDSQLPVVRGAYPDWWTDGFGSAARETAASRKTHADMIAIQGMLSMARVKGQPLPADVHERIRHIHENLLFYDEHTYGAAESISDPTCDNSMIQWAQKSSYAWEALKNAQIMYEIAGGLMQTYIPRGDKPTVAFYNTLNWARSGMAEVYIDHEIIPRNREFKLVDEDGKTAKAQPLRSRNEGTYYAVYAENIPPMGYKTYQIIVGADDIPSSPTVSLNENTIENNYFKIILDTNKGSIKSLFDKELGVEMVDSESPWLLGAFVYETLNNNRGQMERYTLTEFDRKSLRNVVVKPGTDGSVFKSFFIEGKSDGVEEKNGVRVEVRMFHAEKRIELNYTTRKLPITQPDGIYVAFPFKLDNAKLYFDVQGGTVSSGEDQIEGTASDWNTVQNFVSARNNNAQFIIGSDAIPLFQLGGICTGQYQRKKTYDKPHVYSWVTNNYWPTNFRASQEGELRWSYYLTSTGDTSNTVATKFGWASRIPIYARVMPEGKKTEQSAEFSTFSFNEDNFLMVSSTPSITDGYLLINVRELDGKDTLFRLLDTNGNPVEFTVVNIIEERLEEPAKETKFVPYGNKFIKVKL